MNVREQITRLLRERGPSTRGDIASYTGLEPQPLNRILNLCMVSGVIERGWFRYQRCYGLPGTIPGASPGTVGMDIVRTSYREIACEAAALERSNAFEQAAEKWQEAALWATRPTNASYCASRQAFCAHAPLRGWRHCVADAQ